MAENKNPDQGNFGNEAQSDSRDAQNRRAFLKAAVVGSAAVAAVGGASAAGLALTHKSPVPALRFIGAVAQVSPSDPCAVCTTGTDPKDLVDQDTFNNSESIFLWVRFTGVTAGSYTIDVTPTIQSSNSACNTSAPLQYQTPSNSVYSWTFNNGSLPCHPAKLSDWGTATQTDTLPASFTVAKGDTKDLAVAVHLQNGCSSAGDITITGLLKSGGDTVMQCQHTIHINAAPK